METMSRVEDLVFALRDDRESRPWRNLSTFTVSPTVGGCNGRQPCRGTCSQQSEGPSSDAGKRKRTSAGWLSGVSLVISTVAAVNWIVSFNSRRFRSTRRVAQTLVRQLESCRRPRRVTPWTIHFPGNSCLSAVAEVVRLQGHLHSLHVSEVFTSIPAQNDDLKSARLPSAVVDPRSRSRAGRPG